MIMLSRFKIIDKIKAIHYRVMNMLGLHGKATDIVASEISSRPMPIEDVARFLGVDKEDLPMRRLVEPSPVVLFIGAGASKPLGMPTMVEFRQQFACRLGGEEKMLWKAVVQSSAAFYKVKPCDVNIEHVLTCIEDCELSFRSTCKLWQNIYGLSVGKPTIEQIHDFRQRLWGIRNKVIDEIRTRYGKPEPRKVVDAYDRLFDIMREVSNQRSTHVFTTNYDLAFEVLADKLSHKYELVDGFSGSSYVRYYVPKGGSEHSLILHKLHGSTSWEWVGNLQIRKVDPDQNPRPVLIYPSLRKSMSQRLSTQPFNQAYGRFGGLFRQIGAVKALLVIGYGFGDAEVKDEITECLRMEDKAVMIIVDPKMKLDCVQRLFPSIKKRVKVINAGFGNESALQKIRSELEKLV